ncbi:hypothetical protein TSUD_286960 [Trifolium subterraneum]|uniref:Protein kinase domain-containing protein n=1 Tax=Trifolium subterraneum TaxID=3900 RepID=A0A2Z6LRL6_TRISU|nr:hypothetical protein TSUD_286960 [Trifolium subterraneum]
MALNKTGNLLGTNAGDEHGLFPQYNQQKLHSGVTNVHNNIPKHVGGKNPVNFVHDGRVPVSPDIPQNRENRFGLNKENGRVRYEDLTNILGLKRMDSETSSEIGDFIPKRQPAAQEIENGVSPNILCKTQKGDDDNSGRGVLRKSFSEKISDQHGTRPPVSPPICRHERSHSNGFSGSGILDDSLSSGKIKFLCSFGGKILPRPGDSKLRYVGGETHIISIRKDILWEELMDKTLGICSQPHTIKYQLPGEDLDALISVSSDEDLQNMIEEYHGLESHEGSQKLRIFLVPLGESEETPSTEANTVLQNDPDYQYVVALNGVIDPSPKKNTGGQSLINEANQPVTTFNFTPIIVASPLETRDGNKIIRALNPDGILNDPLNLQSALRISPTPVQVAGSSTSYVQLLGNNSCQGSIDSNASFVTAQIDSGNSSINAADCRYPQQASVTLLSDGHPRQHGDVGPPKNLNGQYFDNYNPGNGYSDEAFGGTLHKDRILHSGNPIAQQAESYGTPNDPPHGMSHAFSDSQLQESGARSGYRSQEGISPSFSLNLEKAELSSMLGVSQVNLMEGQHDPFLHHPQIQSKIPKVESAEMHRRQGMASSSPYSESVGTNDRINKDSILTEKKYLNAQTDLSGSGFVEKNIPEHSFKSERMMVNEEKNSIPKKDNKVYEGNSTVNYMSEMRLLDAFPTNDISAKIGMQNNREQPCEDMHPSLYPAVLHDDVPPSLNLPVSDLDNASNNISFMKAPSFLDDWLTSTDQMAVHFKHEHSATGLSKVEDVISGQSKYSERSNDANRVAPFVAVPSHQKSSMVHTPHNFDEGESDVSPSHTEIESTILESDLEDFKDDQTEMNDFLSDVMIAEMEASIYGLQIIKNVDLEELMELGSGTYGTVYHGKWRGTDVAIKRIKKSCFGGRSSEQERLAKDFWREAQILSNLHHPNVLAFYGIVPDGDGGTLATVTEYMVNGSLRHVLVKNNRLLDRRKKLIIAMDAAFGMEYLHSKNIVHFDLKCDNLLVNLRDPQRPICKVDVFSFGISMWELLTGEEPYADMHCGAIIGGIVKNTLRPPIPERCDPEWRKLMEECWSRDPERRPSFTEITSRLRSMSMAIQQGKGNHQAWQLRPSNEL